MPMPSMFKACNGLSCTPESGSELTLGLEAAFASAALTAVCCSGVRYCGVPWLAAGLAVLQAAVSPASSSMCCLLLVQSQLSSEESAGAAATAAFETEWRTTERLASLRAS